MAHITKLTQVVREMPGGRKIIVMQPGARTDEQVATIKSLVGEKDYAKLVKDGVLTE